MTKEGVDTLKGIAIVQVVLLHVISTFPERWWYVPQWAQGLIVLDQLSRMSIPLFIFLSWYGLAKKYATAPLHPLKFLQQRLSKLLPLYLLISVGIWLIMTTISGWGNASHLSLPIKLLFGQAEYHLYFIPLITILYALYPFARKLSATPRRMQVTTVGMLLATIGWYWWLSTGNFPSSWLIQSDQLRYLSPLTWIWYAWLGQVFGMQQQTWWSDRRVSTAFFFATVGSFFLLISDAQSILDAGRNVLDAMQFSRFAVLGFATSVITLLTTTSPLWEKQSRLGILTKIGKHSFLIYLLHTLIIRLTLSQYFAPISLENWIVAFIMSVALISVTSILYRQSLHTPNSRRAHSHQMHS